MITPTGRIQLIAVLLLIIGPKLIGQQRYNNADSTYVYANLEKTDQLDFEGKVEEAIQLIDEINSYCTKKKFTRGLGFAQLKKADLLLKKAQYNEIELLLARGRENGLKIGDSLIVGLSYHQMSQLYRNQTNFEKAVEALKLAEKNYPKLGDSSYLGIVFNDLGYLEDKLGRYDHSIDYNLKALRIFDQLEDKKEMSNTLGNIGITYYRMGDKTNAIQFIKQALSIQTEIGDQKRIASTLGNLATVYTSTDIDSAILYQYKAVEIARKTGLKNLLAQTISNAGKLYYVKKDYKNSFDQYVIAENLYEEIKDKTKQASTLISLADIANRMGDSTMAESFYSKTMSLNQSALTKNVIKQFHESKANFYSERRNYELAIEHLKKSQIYKDSLVDEKTKTNVAELNLKYETEKKQWLLAKLEYEQKQTQTEIDRQRSLNKIANLINIRNKQEIELLVKNKQLDSIVMNTLHTEQQKQEVINDNQEKNIQLLEKEKLLSQQVIRRKNTLMATGILVLVLTGIIFLQQFRRYQWKKNIEEQKHIEEMRDNIAKDLHDDIGSTLTSINILSKVSYQQVDNNVEYSKKLLKDITDQSKIIQQNMSDIVWALKPDHDSIQAFEYRLREFSSKTLELEQINVRFDLSENTTKIVLPINIRKELVLIGKELLNNISKHAFAKNVTISFSHSQNHLFLKIEDDGIGISDKAWTGSGIQNIQKRCQHLGGQFVMKNRHPGTESLVTIPLT
ncbi:MAG TPA: tetratricopeptide repeat protein [Saprospiraceae bacterium]|nr:tetratricopeptide repeat protein [Saprospiraceae bacterium]HMZ39621.1 tetratricopeptide repeat protein [Saprospiraceae bacterium]HNA63736.1 tetratricopeptide repeat protein [Saprospiraceae bacterium]HNB29486.1 tetratricopeptide repeat protein [Saprospiraceae bacterium]HNM53313.1 tetratricopeptide repeat protein [Saprospiraceae bacterium]